MDDSNLVIIAAWLVWATILLALHVSNRRMLELLRQAHPEVYERVRFQDGTQDVLEPFKWLLRLRRFVGTELSKESYPEQLRRKIGHVRILLFLFVIVGAALALGIAVVTVQQIRPEAFRRP